MSIILHLGEFMFQTLQDNVRGLDITTDGRLAEQDVLQRIAPVQSLGPGGRTISIDGIILPEHQGGIGQIDALHAAADDGEARGLATGYGRYFGLFKIKRVSEKDSILAYGGLPRKIEFRIDLIRAGADGVFFGLF